MEIYNLNFMHPEYGTIFNADVDVSFTANEMLKNLVLTGFLPERSAGYRLALMDEVLKGEDRLGQLQQLDDGVVLRIIPLLEEAKGTEVVAESPIEFFIRHPYSAEYAPFRAMPSSTGKAMLEALQSRGFLKEIPDSLGLYFKEQPIPLDQALGDQGLPLGAYLELRDSNAQAADAVLRNLLLGLDSFQASTNQKLEEIIKQMPPPSAIPIDPNRSISPTADIYESVDSLITDIRREGNFPPPKKIRIWSPVPLIFWLSLAVTGLTLIILAALDVI
jgi:hypothetical protein